MVTEQVFSNMTRRQRKNVLALLHDLRREAAKTDQNGHAMLCKLLDALEQDHAVFVQREDGVK